jgi:hypothetical protein
LYEIKETIEKIETFTSGNLMEDDQEQATRVKSKNRRNPQGS